MLRMKTVKTSVALLSLLLIASGCSSPDDGERDAGADSGADGSTSDGDVSDGDVDDSGPADPCQPNPCDEPNRGQCVPLEEGQICECDPGFHEDEAGGCVADQGCLETTCNGHGLCTEVDGESVCDCEVGYTGDSCTSCDEVAGYFDDGHGGCTNSPCDPNPCVEPGRTSCVAEDGVVRCDCNPGSHDADGECVADVTCGPDTCNGHGACSEVADGVSCDCDLGYTGQHCESCDELAGYHSDGLGGCTNDPCVPNHCSDPHRSICVATDTGTRCDCDRGYHLDDDHCVEDEVCDATSCSGRGECEVLEGRLLCTCDEGYAGIHCEGCDEAAGYHDDGAGGCTLDPCIPNPCGEPNQSLCVPDATTGHRCECDDGYHDDSVGGCTDDPCVPDPCAPDRACRDDGTGSPECYTPICNDDNPCTADEIRDGSCHYDPLPDGTGCSTTPCITDQQCAASDCSGGSVVICDDGNPCTDDSCDDLLGCDYVVNETNIPDDGVHCTTDSCVGGAPANTPDDGACEDGSWCTGVEACDPADPLADVEGCVHLDPPAPPGPSGPCGDWSCDDGTHAFELDAYPAGTTCNDGIGCTFGDECDATGVCLGTPTARCYDPDASCSELGAFTSDLDVPRAVITGDITLDGGALPDGSPSSGGLIFYLLSQDTRVRHRIASVGFGGCCSSYTRVLGTESYGSLVMPGVYDVLYSRNYTSTYDYVYDSIDGDPFVNGERVLAEDIIVPRGTTVLDLDVPSATISGGITLNSGALPDVSPSSGSLSFYLVSQDTNVRHRIASVGFGGCCSAYTRVAGTENYDSLVMPGIYDLRYERNFTSSYDYVYDSIDGDEFVNGVRLLAEDVVIPPGVSTLDIDVPAATLSGNITQDGGLLPDESPSSGSLSFYLVSRDTGVRHRIASVGFGGCCSAYTRVAGSEVYESLVMPGEYDLRYERNYTSSYDYVYDSIDGDPFVNGVRTLQEGLIISAGANVVDLDVPSASVSGVITLDGGPLPDESPSSGSLSFYLVSRDTAVRHRIASVGFGGCCSAYTRVAGSEAYDSLVMPGVYDVRYERNFTSSYDYVYDSIDGDPFVNGVRTLQEGLVISSGANTLNLDLPTATVSGSITLGGGPLPDDSPSSGSLSFYLVSRDTGVRHRVASVGFGGCCSAYTRVAGSETFDSLVMPGVYDLRYERNYTSSYDYVYDSIADDPFVNGVRLLAEDIVIPAGASTLDIDVPVATIAGNVLLDGDLMPDGSPSSGSLSFYLVSHDTGVRHRVASVGFGGCCSAYTRVAGSEVYDSLVMPGVYDVRYERNYTSSYDYVYDSIDGDAFVNAVQELQSCVIVP